MTEINTLESDEWGIRCFMDGIDWQHHLGADTLGTTLYPSVEELKAAQPHLLSGQCGIVEVTVRLVRWVEKQNLFGETGEDGPA